MADHEAATTEICHGRRQQPRCGAGHRSERLHQAVQAWQPGMQATGTLKGWLYRVTHNEAVDYIRRESRLQTLTCATGRSGMPRRCR